MLILSVGVNDYGNDRKLEGWRAEGLFADTDLNASQ